MRDLQKTRKLAFIEAFSDSLESKKRKTQKELARAVEISDRTVRTYMKEYENDIIDEMRRRKDFAIARLVHFYLEHLTWKTMNNKELTPIEHHILSGVVGWNGFSSGEEEMINTDDLSDEEIEKRLNKYLEKTRRYNMR